MSRPGFLWSTSAYDTFDGRRWSARAPWTATGVATSGTPTKQTITMIGRLELRMMFMAIEKKPGSRFSYPSVDVSAASRNIFKRKLAIFWKRMPIIAMVPRIETMKVSAAGRSCALATWPFLRASFNFFGVAFSVFSAIA